MAGIGGLLGMGGGASGSGFSAPSGVNPQQMNTAYDQTQQGIQQQQDFVNALRMQNGLGNQQDVFHQLQGVANGTGPNPAKAMLANATGANVANQAALMAGQRGASANTGLIARQAAQQGAGIQQNAAGQAAQLQAQQGLNAINSMGNLANTQVNQMQSGLTGLNQNSLQQQANLMGLQGNINDNNARLAGASQGAQANMFGGLMGGMGSAIGGLFGGGGGAMSGAAGPSMAGGAGDAIGGAGDMMVAAHGGMVPKYANGGMTAPVESNNVVALDQPQQSGPSSKVGQMFNSHTSQDTAAPAKGGGANPLGALSGLAQPAMQAGMGFLKNKVIGEGLGKMGEFFGGMGSAIATVPSGFGGLAGGAADAIGTGATSEAVAAGGAEAAPVLLAAAKGGKVPALVSPGERYLPPKKVEEVKKGANPMSIGKKVPGKPKVGGAVNDYSNDTVPAELEEGGIVIPRSITQSKDAGKKAAAFVEAILAKNKHMPKKSK